MKRLTTVALIALALVTAACGQDEPVVTKGSIIDGSIEGTITRTTIDGMPCLVWQNKKGALDHTYAYSGITCDWSQKPEE